MKSKILIAISFIFASCSSTEVNNSNDSVVLHDTTRATFPHDTMVNLPKDLFSEMFPFDWEDYKLHRTKMVSCADVVPGLYRGNPKGFYFSYCLTKAQATDIPPLKPTSEQLEVGAEYVTWFTGRKQSKDYYDSIHETLVSVRCRVNDDRLQGMNLLSKSKTQLDSILGASDSVSFNHAFYMRGNELLHLEYNGDTLNSFQWFRFDSTFSNIRSVPAKLLQLEF